jgi:hypothetical protein
VLAAVLWGALIGGAIFEAVGVALALLATDSGALQLFVAAWAWKLGLFLGGFVGLFAVDLQGAEVQARPPYRNYLDGGATVLAVGGEGRDASQVRGILIESGSEAVEDVEGSLLVSKEEAPIGRQPGEAEVKPEEESSPP